ncbi:hypothetical protein C8R44DRAFT_753804 [Mycena epipterygia]|nr:hypothetical protein C8R44DRAFT_753804 [Mycena epipterygia]
MLEQQRLGADLRKWHEQQQQICPQVIPYIIAEPYRPPQDKKLFLPSDFNAPDRTRLGLDILGGEELKLRRGEANDALHSLRDHIRHSQALRQHKNSRKNAVHGQEKTHVQLKDSAAARVQWHRARADMERWQEEVEILGQEFRRAIQGFIKMETVWNTLAQDHKDNPGKQAYALKTANIYHKMCEDAQSLQMLEALGPVQELLLPNTSNLSAQSQKLTGREESQQMIECNFVGCCKIVDVT